MYVLNAKKRLFNQNGHYIVEHIMYMAPTWNDLTE
jgi:hypothetical protein